MSTSLIVNLAFLTGLILSYKMLKKVIRNALDKKRNKNKVLHEEFDKFGKDICDYYKNFSRECEELDIKTKKLIDDACNKAETMIECNKQELNKTLYDNVSSNTKRASNRITKAIEGLRANTADVAGETVKKMMDDKRSSAVTPPTARKLDEKLH